MSGKYLVMVGSATHMPLIRVYYLDRSKKFVCASTKVENPFRRERYVEEFKRFGKGEIGMIQEMLHIKGIAAVSIETNKLIVHRDPWCTWEDIEEKIKTLMEGVLGENGDFLPMT